MGPIRDYFVVRETTQRKQRKKAPNTVEPDRFFSHKRILNSSGNGVVLILCLYGYTIINIRIGPHKCDIHKYLRTIFYLHSNLVRDTQRSVFRNLRLVID